MSETPITDGWTTVKSWYKSKTMIGIAISLISQILPLFIKGWDGDLKGTVEMIMGSGDAIAEAGQAVHTGIVTLIGLAVAAWGRIKAKTGIK